MSVRVGSARIDEQGKATGGKAGDQTGGEVSTQTWYKHSKGWVVIRAKDDTVRSKIAEAMESACANNHIGYDQSQRNTLYNAVKSLGFNPGRVTTDVETDCSALVRVCCAFAGIVVGDFNTSSEVSVLEKTGKFEIIKTAATCNSSVNLKRGDILVTKTKGHTVVVLDNGSNIGSQTTNTTSSPVTGGEEVKASGSASHMNKAYAGSYKVTASMLNIRDKASSANGVKVLTSIPKDTVVKNYGYYSMNGNVVWLYIQTTYKGVTYTGFCSKAYLKKV